LGKGGGMEMRFGATKPYTVGVEEEFQLVDPPTRELTPAIEGVIGASLENTERMAPELFQDCVP
jgi:gamma-glutamyl:cysteine ligase YbdK (ATP-grasp superfamily)